VGRSPNVRVGEVVEIQRIKKMIACGGVATSKPLG
jgi:hypothetical protein